MIVYRSDFESYTEYMLVIRKRDGVKLALPLLGWEWVRGIGCPGAWCTKSRQAVDILANRHGAIVQRHPHSPEA